MRIQSGRGRGVGDLHSPDRGRRDGIKKAPASLPGLRVVLKSLRARSPRRCEFYPKAHITPMVVQKMPVRVQKNAGQTISHPKNAS